MRTHTCGAVIFDMDGTLLDTIEDIADSMNEALSRMGFAGHPVNTYLAFVGDGIEALAERSLPESERAAQTVAEAVRIMREVYAERWSVKSRPYAGIGDVLDGLSSLNIPMSILSNKLDGFTKAMAASLLADWTFVEVRGLVPGGTRKPDPAGALECARLMGVDPAACILVGDSGIDMETAVRAGMAGFGALWGYQDRERLLARGARVLMEDPRELLGYL
jgi:phosphoglycolate phosphatase